MSFWCHLCARLGRVTERSARRPARQLLLFVCANKRARRSELVLGALRSQQAAGLRADNGVATLDQAKAEFDASWKK
jgi:hypothetical protein